MTPGGLEEYRRKRDFAFTPEPEPSSASGAKGGGSFVVQKHAASHLHYDFRLEMDGVLRSWAIPKEPSVQQGVRRLAVQVEDHPIEYGSFQGTIPAGHYGAGTVEIWDRGTYELESRHENKLVFHLQGERLRGRFALVETGQGQWLFFKARED